jgi:hypothetical protein
VIFFVRHVSRLFFLVVDLDVEVDFAIVTAVLENA